MHSSLRHRTISGLIWAAIGQFGSLSIHYIVVLALAWFLSPVDFGLVGLAMVFINFTQVVGELGLVQAIVQQPNPEEPMLSTAFWANLALSFSIAVLTYTNAELITGFLGNDTGTLLLKALSIVFPITALAVVPNALLRRNLEFNRLAGRDFVSELAFGVIGLTLALMGARVWSLVGAIVAQRVAHTAMLWVVVPWRPRLKFSLHSLRQLLGFGSYAMISAIFNKGFSHIDYFIVGKWLGTETLGYYTLAFQLTVVPLRRLMGVLNQVAFSAFSLIQNDLLRLKTSFAEGTQHLFAVVVPFSLFLAALGPYFIEILYGQEWLPAALPFQVLAIAGLFYAFDIAGSLYFAVGKPKFRSWILGLRMTFFVVFVATFGLSSGVVGVAVSLTLSVALTSFIGFLIVARITQAMLRELLKALWPAARGALCICVLVITFKLLRPASVISSWLVLVGLGIAMALVYVMALAPAYSIWLKALLNGAQRYTGR